MKWFTVSVISTSANSEITVKWGCVPLLQDHFSKTLLLPENPIFSLSVPLKPNKPNPYSQKVVVREMDLTLP